MKFTSFFLLLAAATLSPMQSTHAGGPLQVTATGAATRWGTTTGTNVTLNPDGGTCGPYSNATTLTMLEDSLDNWTGLSEVDFTFNVVADSVGDINGNCEDANNDGTYDDSGCYGNYLIDEPDSINSLAINDDLTPIVFDDDGEVIDAIFGNLSYLSIFGFASPALFASDYSQIFDGQAAFNCRCVTGHPSGACASFSISANLLKLTMTHEIGHFMGLTHTQINLDIRDDGVASNDDGVPIMIPELDPNATSNSSLALITTPMADDIVAMARIYPSTTFATTHCLVTGTITNVNGDPMRCVDVQAIPTDRTEAVAAVTGAYAIATDDNSDDTVNTDNCTSGCGDFQLYLTPGIDYTISAQTIDSDFVGARAILPCRDAQLPNCADCADSDTTCIDTCLTETTLGSLPAASCTAGATVNLGELQTQSTGGSNTTTTTASTAASCALVTSAKKSAANEIILLIVLVGLRICRGALRASEIPPPPLIKGGAKGGGIL